MPPRRWQQFIDDIGRFLDGGVAEKANELGWGAFDIFGCDRDRPFARIDQQGLCWLIAGNRLADLSENTAIIQTWTGATNLATTQPERGQVLASPRDLAPSRERFGRDVQHEPIERNGIEPGLISHSFSRRVDVKYRSKSLIGGISDAIPKRMPWSSGGGYGEEMKLVGATTVELPSATSRARARAKAAYPWQFQPGRSGNPSGQSHFYHECRKIAREASPEMMRALIELAKTAEDERVRSVCLVAVLDRAGVKPIDFDPDETAGSVANMPLEERKARLFELMQRAQTILGLHNADLVEVAPTEDSEES